MSNENQKNLDDIVNSHSVSNGDKNKNTSPQNVNAGEDKNAMSDFDLFAPPPASDLEEEIVKGRYQWTDKYTKIFLGLFVIVGLLSAGAWYGHRTALASSNAAGAATRSAFASAFGAGGSGRSAFGGGGSGFTFGGTAPGGASFGTSGKVSSVSNGTVTITLSTPTSTLAAGDRVTIIPRAGFGGAGAGGAAGGFGGATASAPAANGAAGSSSGASSAGGSTPGGVSTPATGKGSTTRTTPPATKSTGAAGTPTGSAPSVTGGRTGGGAPRFSNPAFTKCLAANGVTLTPGARPDRTDPKVAAALQACFSKLGGGFGGGFGGAGAPPAGANSAPSTQGGSTSGSTSGN